MYLGFRPPGTAGRARRLDDRRLLLPNGEAYAALASQRVAHDRAEQVEEVTVDPFPGEVVRRDDDERVVRELGSGDGGEPGR